MSDTDSYPTAPNGYAPSGVSGPLSVTGTTTLGGFGSVPNGGIVRKKLTGYVGFANLPNQVHRKSVRKGFQFTCMVVGTFCFHHPLLFFSLWADGEDEGD